MQEVQRIADNRQLQKVRCVSQVQDLQQKVEQPNLGVARGADQSDKLRLWRRTEPQNGKERSLEIMLKIVQRTQRMLKQQKKTDGSEGPSEVVKNNTHQLPKLVEYCPSAPIDLGDWISWSRS